MWQILKASLLWEALDSAWKGLGRPHPRSQFPVEAAGQRGKLSHCCASQGWKLVACGLYQGCKFLLFRPYRVLKPRICYIRVQNYGFSKKLQDVTWQFWTVINQIDPCYSINIWCYLREFSVQLPYIHLVLRLQLLTLGIWWTNIFAGLTLMLWVFIHSFNTYLLSAKCQVLVWVLELQQWTKQIKSSIIELTFY